MLIYHPAYDAYHCVFRSILITNRIKIIEVAKLRILDFFLCFPSEIKRIRLPRTHGEARRISQSAENPYHGPVSMHQVFQNMEHIQLAAYRTLAASRLIMPDEFETGLVRRTDIEVPEELRTTLSNAFTDNQPLVDYLVDKLGQIELLGIDGLKHRTNLMEHRYDVA